MRKACFSFIWLVIAFFFGCYSAVMAQDDGWLLSGETHATNPKARTASVSASVPDFFDPSTPVLIAPANNATNLTTSTPTFSWYGVTDNVGVDHYQIWLDGASWFNSLSTGSQTTSAYTLIYAINTNIYTLVAKTGIGDGTHTWKISAYDAAGRSSTSATWSFTIDTQAPSFVVTDVGAEKVTISAGDLSTIPALAIELSKNEPLLKGTGEANATVSLTVLKDAESLYSYSFTIGSDGTWTKQLPSLERDVEITLNFTITDTAGNIRLLEGVKLIIRIPTLVIPPIAEVGPGTPSPISGLIPSIEIPLLAPAEIVSEIVDKAARELEGIMPAPFQKFVTAGSGPIVTALRERPAWTNWLAVLLLVLPILLATLDLAKTFGSKISVQLLGRVWQALGLLPGGKRVAIAINSLTGKPSAYTWLHISGTNVRKENVDEYWLSDADGYFRSVILPEGYFRASLTAPKFSFPTSISRPPDIGPAGWYRGEPWTGQAGRLNGWIFPLDLKPTHVHQNGSREHLYQLATLRGQWWKTHLGLCGLIALLWPSLWNLGVVFIYGVSLAVSGWQQSRQSRAELITTDADAHLMSYVTLVRIGQTEQEFQITQSFQGQVKLNSKLKSGQTLRVLKPDYLLSSSTDSLVINKKNLENLPLPIVLHGRKERSLTEIIN